MPCRWVRLVAVIGSLAVAAAAAGCSATTPSSKSLPPATTSSPAGSPQAALAPETPWQHELHNVQPDGSRSLASVLRLFAIAFGPIPGVDAQPGAPGSVDSATPAVEAARARLAEMSPEQRQAVLQYLSPHPQGDAIEVPGPRASAAVTISREATAGAPVRLASTRSGNGAAANDAVLVAALSDVRSEVVADASQAWGAAATYYGNLGINLEIQFVDAAAASFRTYLDFGDLRSNCDLYVNSSTWDGSSARRALTLDVVHCFQDAFEREAASAAHRSFQPGAEGLWSTYGAAEYITIALWSPTAEDTQAWERYLLMPDVPLFEREEDAVGYYVQAKYDGLDLATVMQGVLVDPSEGTSTVSTETAADRFAAAGTATSAFLFSWASELSQTDWGHDWALHADWPVGSGVDAPRDPLGVTKNSVEAVSQPAYSNHLFAVHSDADIVVFDVEGYARVGDGRVDSTGLAPGYFCTTDRGCGPCPDGSAPSIQPSRLAPDSVLAISGGTDGTTGTVTGHDLDEFCHGSPPPSATAVQVKEVLKEFGTEITRVDLVSCDGPYGHWSGVIYGVLTYERPMSFYMGGGSGDVTVTVTPDDAHLPNDIISVSGNIDVAVQHGGTTMVLSGVTDYALRGPNGPLPGQTAKFSLAYQIMPADPGRCP